MSQKLRSSLQDPKADFIVDQLVITNDQLKQFEEVMTRITKMTNISRKMEEELGKGSKSAVELEIEVGKIVDFILLQFAYVPDYIVHDDPKFPFLIVINSNGGLYWTTELRTREKDPDDVQLGGDYKDLADVLDTITALFGKEVAGKMVKIVTKLPK